MPEKFTPLFRQRADSIIRAWADRIYAERRTDLPSLLSYEQLVDYLPELLEELARSLDEAASKSGIAESVRRLRFHAQVRFQQGCLIDEVARELIILREVLGEFLWREGISATDGDIWELRDALCRLDLFIDELIAQLIVVYAASLRPPVRTRASIWPPPRRRRRTDYQKRDEDE